MIRTARQAGATAVLVVVLAWTASADAEPVRVTTTVEPKDVTIGTPFRYSMRIEADPDVAVSVPILSGQLGDFTIKDFGGKEPEERADGTRVVERWYDLLAYETGSQFIPPVPLSYRRENGESHTIDSPKALVNVVSVLSRDEEATDIRDIKEAEPISAGWSLFWLLSIATVAAAVLMWGLYRLLNRARAARPAASRLPHDVALAELARLQSRRLPDEGRHEEYYVALSAIVRQYIEARFGLRAPEMTTDEFFAAAQRRRELATEHRSALHEFLAEADLVKFARHVPTRERAERAWSAAHEFVVTTKPRAEDERAAA